MFFWQQDQWILHKRYILHYNIADYLQKDTFLHLFFQMK